MVVNLIDFLKGFECEAKVGIEVSASDAISCPSLAVATLEGEDATFAP
jgi:hypothetical protein